MNTKVADDLPADLTEEVAVLRIDPAEAEATLGFPVKDDFDDLDTFSYVVFQTEGYRYALVRYKHAPNPGMTLIMDKKCALDLNKHLDFVLKFLELHDHDVIWKRHTI